MKQYSCEKSIAMQYFCLTNKFSGVTASQSNPQIGWTEDLLETAFYMKTTKCVMMIKHKCW